MDVNAGDGLTDNLKREAGPDHTLKGKCQENFPERSNCVR